MPKIKTQPVSLDPRTSALNIAVPSPRPGRITKARPQRVFDSGKGILSDVLSDVGQGLYSLTKYLAIRDAKMLETEASDYLADLANFYNKRLIADIAPKRSGSAKDLFKQEVVITQEGKDTFLERAGENKKLRDMLSIGYDSITQIHLQKVLQHKLAQDEVYIKDVKYKVAKNLQVEMTTLEIKDSSKAIAISNQIDAQLKDQPILRELMKLEAFKGWFKFNARVNPDLTQDIYESSEARKSIVNQIGFKGYDSIQEAIDVGRKIKIQNDLLAKVHVAEKKAKDVETIMGGAISLYLTEPYKFTADLVDSLKLASGENLPSKEKRILIGFLSSLATGKILTAAEVDYTIYAELLEDVRRGKASDIKIGETQNKIIGYMNRVITNTQGSTLLKALSNRDMFDKPVIQEAFDKLENMYVKEGDFTQIEYLSVVQSLVDTIVKYDGDTKKVQEFMQDVLEPAVRRSWWRKWRSKDPAEFEFQEDIIPYMSDQEKGAIVTLLADKNQKTKKGETVTIDMLDDNKITEYLEFVRSNEYLKLQNLKAKRGKAKVKTKTKQLPTLTQ